MWRLGSRSCGGARRDRGHRGDSQAAERCAKPDSAEPGRHDHRVHAADIGQAAARQQCTFECRIVTGALAWRKTVMGNCTCVATITRCSIVSMGWNCRKGLQCSARHLNRGLPTRWHSSPEHYRRNTVCCRQRWWTSPPNRGRPIPGEKFRCMAARGLFPAVVFLWWRRREMGLVHHRRPAAFAGGNREPDQRFQCGSRSDQSISRLGAHRLHGG